MSFLRHCWRESDPDIKLISLSALKEIPNG